MDLDQTDKPKPKIDGVPPFLYGTAWKEEQTERLTGLAIEQGFRGIDTANQRKHYHEAAVGRAVTAAIKSGLVVRDSLFLQTKYTFQRGQDHRLPYDPTAPIANQVQQSFEKSLEHLGTDYIDSYVLHGPSLRIGLTDDDWSAWRAMEILCDSGRALALGVSNVSVNQLEILYQQARIKPRFVQNRCYAVDGWDVNVRRFCQAEGLIYQGFSLLTANTAVLGDRELVKIAKRIGKTVNQIVFRFAIDIGILPLTGTTNPEHMQQDLSILDFSLDKDVVDQIERIGIQ